MKRSMADKEALVEKLRSGDLSKSQESDLLDDFLGVVRKTPLQIKVKETWAAIKEYPELKEMGVKLISLLKSEVEGRGKVEAQTMERRQRIFDVSLQSLKS